jgi:hypothetical protein
MNHKMMLAAAFLSLSATTAAFAGEGNNEPFPLSISIGTEGQTYVSTLADTHGLPVDALNGTSFYAQAQSLTRWYAQQSDHQFAEQPTVQARHG